MSITQFPVSNHRFPRSEWRLGTCRVWLDEVRQGTAVQWAPPGTLTTASLS